MITTAQHSIGTTAVLISAAHHMDVLCHIHNEENNGHPIYIGNADVTSSTGLQLSVNEDIELEIPPGEELYAIATGSNRELHVLRIAED